jgi:hypothetical protein
MAEDRSPSNSSSSSRSGRGGRRRYFRRRTGGAKSSEENRKETPPARRAEQETGGTPARNSRVTRRRKRTRNRSAEAIPQPVAPSAESITNLSDYRPPEDVFIYTHITRPGSRDSYEFRAEHFSKVGRRLEDYDIDLSSLYSDSVGQDAISPDPDEESSQ